MFNKSYLAGILFILTLVSTSSVADVVINGTRIVFNAKDKESTAQLKNNGKKPYLLQMWIDDSNPKSRPGEAKVPFMVNPPVIRIEPGKGQAVRIMATNPALPQDRETLFWFNMLEIPPKPTEQLSSGDNLIQLAFRTRIKLFYRPAGLKTSPLDAYKNLQITVKGKTVSVINNSPYYITFSRIEIRKSKNTEILGVVDKFAKRMVEPNGNIEFPITIKKQQGISGASLFYSIINDYGGESTNEQVLPNNI